MEQNTVIPQQMPPQPVKKNSNLGIKCACLGLIIITLGSLGASGFIGWKYYKQSRNQDTNRTAQNNSGDPSKFTADTTFTPSGDVIDLVKRTGPAVVTVISKQQAQSSLFEGDEQETVQGVGTGFFVSEDGLLITNQHVVCSVSPQNLTVATADNKTYKVTSSVVDAVQDIAILKVDIKNDKINFLKFANLDTKVEVGQDVIAIGNPLGVNPGSVTRGIISGLGRYIKAQGACGQRSEVKEYEGIMQTDAAINTGNSGGPLINLKGEVIGVNSATSVGANNISYSVPFERVVRLLARYQQNNGKLTFPFIGVTYQMIDQNVAKARELPTGALVQAVSAGGPAANAGIQKDDIIIKIGDKPTDFSLQSVLNQHFEPGQKVKVEIYRPTQIGAQNQGKTMTLDLTIGQNDILL